MALRTPPSWLQNGSHPAEQDRLTTQGLFRTSGVLYASDLAVAQSTVPAMSVQIAAGWGNIIGTTQANMGAYQFYNDAAATATITTADVTNPRIDLICITINDAYYVGSTNNVAINVVAGTPAGSPAVPALPANSYALAQVAVAANATTIVTANITDLRQVSYPVNTATSPAGKNRLINGDMATDQRNSGATQTLTAAAAAAYTVDRWLASCTGANVNGARVAGTLTSRYRYQFTGAASVTGITFKQRIEAANSYDLNTKTATLSVDLANSLLTTVTWVANYATVTDTFTSVTQIATGTFTVTSTVTNYNVQIAIPAAATTGIEVVLSVGAQVSGTFTVGNTQLEAGSLATTFSRSGGSIGGETALCQRYYERFSDATSFFGPGFVNSATLIYGIYAMKVEKRALPTFSSSSATAFTYFTPATGTLTGTANSGANLSSTKTAVFQVTGAGMTGGQGGMLGLAAASWFELSSEL